MWQWSILERKSFEKLFEKEALLVGPVTETTVELGGEIICDYNT